LNSSIGDFCRGLAMLFEPVAAEYRVGQDLSDEINSIGIYLELRRICHWNRERQLNEVMYVFVSVHEFEALSQFSFLVRLEYGYAKYWIDIAQWDNM
jgi:hypothetical protein